jgi:hypothetical protein
VREGLVARTEDYAWSSARARVLRQPDALLAETRPFSGPVDDWSQWLASLGDEGLVETLRRNPCPGRPAVSASFVEQLDERLNRVLRPVRVTCSARPRRISAMAVRGFRSLCHGLRSKLLAAYGFQTRV